MKERRSRSPPPEFACGLAVHEALDVQPHKRHIVLLFQRLNAQASAVQVTRDGVLDPLAGPCRSALVGTAPASMTVRIGLGYLCWVQSRAWALQLQLRPCRGLRPGRSGEVGHWIAWRLPPRDAALDVGPAPRGLPPRRELGAMMLVRGVVFVWGGFFRCAVEARLGGFLGGLRRRVRMSRRRVVALSAGACLLAARARRSGGRGAQ